jgi:hypothetical protein
VRTLVVVEAVEGVGEVIGQGRCRWSCGCRPGSGWSCNGGRCGRTSLLTIRFALAGCGGWAAAATGVTATLVSIRSCGPSPLVGISEHPDGLIADRRVGRDEEAVLVRQVVVSPVALRAARRRQESLPLHQASQMAGRGLYQLTCGRILRRLA